jgi:acetylornithine deacetylase/succinyl-diaminopimelate desuccinylase-like protein
MLDPALTYAKENREKHLAQLIDWIKIPSVSTLPEHKDDVRRAGQFAMDLLSSLGFQVEVTETPGHPIVFAEENGLDAPTLLIYGHFDVQPVDPVDKWTRPPFEPVVEGDSLYARGASDDKGQAFAVLAALESYIKTSGKLPVNVKVLFEGEEEVTSQNLFPYVQANIKKLAADAILICDQDMLDPQHPIVMYGVRGNLYAEIEVTGPAQDLHSGTFGGAADNPFNVLTQILAQLQDGVTRRVLIPGFYDQVEELSTEERALIAKAPINDPVGLNITGAPALGGEQGYSLAERISVRPTFDIHGIMGGFTGEGSKTVIPAKATAKVSMRLVPDQDPKEIASALEAYLRQIAPGTVKVTLKVLGMANPLKVDIRAPAVKKAAEAYRAGFGCEAVFLRGGGSLPIAWEMVRQLSPPGGRDIPIVMIGFGLPDDHTHAPNEKFHLPNFYAGIESIIHYLDLFTNS